MLPDWRIFTPKNPGLKFTPPTQAASLMLTPYFGAPALTIFPPLLLSSQLESLFFQLGSAMATHCHPPTLFVPVHEFEAGVYKIGYLEYESPRETFFISMY